MAFRGMIYRIAVVQSFLSLVVRAQLPDDGFRRCGLQGAVMNNSVWLDGGHEVSLNMSGSWTATNLTQINFNVNFTIPDSFSAAQLFKPPEVPDVSYGTLWSNEIDTFWLYGGQSLQNNAPNTIWRYQMDPNYVYGNWSQVSPTIANLSGLRRTEGSGCNVPSQSIGYYLGGRSSSNTSASVTLQYFHSMVVFDMNQESSSVIDVPDFVPIVGQSLVYMDVGVNGILIAVGGRTEADGVLKPTSLAVVYIYDIASNTWVIQQTTDIFGRNNSFHGEWDDYQPGIPNSRWNMCATAGVAPDGTSYNLYVFGGQNETNTPGDIWALSLPSSVWIRMNSTDLTNDPKRGSSCNLINSRFLLMADGCWAAGNGTCFSYGWNPLLYDIAVGDWGWTFDTSAEGYYIPEQISEIVGGSYQGGAKHTTPIYTAFSDHLVASIFAPQPDFGAGRSIRVLQWVVTGLGSCGVALWANQQNSTDKYNWKPWPMKIPFLSVLFMATVILIIVIQMLWHISSLTDADPSRWSGGLESEGTWQGQPFESAFIPAPGEGRPIRGLVSFYLDTGTSGNWARKNASQRMGLSVYILWTYIPSTVAVVYGVLWTILDGELKRVEKFYQLTSPNGSSGKSSICLDYHCFWTPMAIFQALRFRQWTIVLSSIGYVIAVIAVPNIQNYVFNWAVYAGGDLNQGGTYSWQVGYIDLYWAKVLIAVLVVDLACILGLVVLVHCRRSGLQDDPKGIIAWVKLTVDVADAPVFGLEIEDSFACSYEIHLKLKDMRFQISVDATQVLRVLDDIPSPSHHQVPSRFWELFPQPLLNMLAKIQETCERLAKFALHVYYESILPITEYASNIFSPFILIPWVAWLILSLCANIYILSKIASSEQLTLKNYVLPWSPNIYLVVGVLIQSIYQVFERNVRAVVILDTLRQGYQHPEILWEDFSSGDPIIEIFQAFDKHQYLLGYTLLGSVATVIYTIMLGSLQVSASFYGATDFNGDLSGVVFTFLTNLFILIVTLAAAWTYGRGKLFPRYPGTVASFLPYILSSERLRQDCREVSQVGEGKKAHIEHLRAKCRRYGFGEFSNEESPHVRHLGIERNYNYGSEGKEFVQPWKR